MVYLWYTGIRLVLEARNMEYILNAKEMKNCDDCTTSEYGIPSLVLMERAALETAKIILEEFGTDVFVGIVAGSGNNGGDGIAVARILKEYGVRTEIIMAGNVEHYTEQTKLQVNIAQKHGIPIKFLFDCFCYDVIVDALLGIGISRAVEGNYKKTIDLINESDAKVVSIDIPSGLSADSGEILGNCVKADLTVTFGAKKFGHILYPGTTYCGKTICVPIGIPFELIRKQKNKAIIFESEDLHLPARREYGNKGNFGKVFLVAGSRNMGGACQLSAASAFRIGAGMVRIFTAEENRDSLLKKVPEAMISCYEDTGNVIISAEKEEILRGLDWADVVAIGPGISTSETALSILECVLEHNRKPLVIDADALNLLSENPALLQSFADYTGNSRDVVMTPHMGEFSRLIQYPVSEIKKDTMKFARSFTHKYHVTLVCKDARTIVTQKNRTPYVNISGNSGMATAGSGDVLTGIIAGLIAQGMDVHEAATLGTYVHGVAGDIAKSKTSAYYIMSQDIIHALQYL